jgi:hypothetical protein
MGFGHNKPGQVGATGPQGPTGEGVPSGGTTDQILKKINATDYNTAWVDISTLETDTLQTITDRGAVTTKGAAFNTGATSTNDFVFGKSTIVSLAKGFCFDQSKGSFAAGLQAGSGEFSTYLGNNAARFGKGTKSQGDGSFSFGNAAYAYGPTQIRSSGIGSLAGGKAYWYSYVYSTNEGSCAIGNAYYYSTVQATGKGAQAFGRADYFGTIQATGVGSFAQGYARDSGTINASGLGAHASGYAAGGGAVSATGKGSFAHGYGNGLGTYATANNAFAMGYGAVASAVQAAQFGYGTNNVANSLQVGSTVWVRPNTVWMKEKASEVDATATWGKLWVKNTTPCELWFTDDAGTATKIV